MKDTAEQGSTELPLGRPTRLSFLAGRSDRRRLLFTDDQGREFQLDVTPELRAAVRGETPRRTEPSMSSSIRPREIQTRIRAGESAEAVAEAAGTSVDAIMPYVAPVLAEREHIAERAQRASVRRTPGEGQGAPQSRVLGDAVAAHLQARGSRPEAVSWDAYRRDTGRWVLTGTFDTDERGGTARFTYDAPGNYVLSDNDDARWLIGDALPVAEPVTSARDDLQQVRERRLSAVPEELPLGGDVDALPFGDTFDQALDLAASAAPAAEPADAAPAEATTPTPASDEPIRATTNEASEANQADEAEGARHRRPVQKKRGRASVPSWDEIMFGGGDQ